MSVKGQSALQGPSQCASCLLLHLGSMTVATYLDSFDVAADSIRRNIRKENGRSYHQFITGIS